MSDGKGKITTLAEVPVELIREAAASYQQVMVRVKRQTPRGTWATIGPSVLKDTLELASIDSWLREIAGGGKYRVEALDPSDPTRPVVPSYWVEVEGSPRPIASTRAQFAQGQQPAAPPGMMAPPFAATQPAFGGGGGFRTPNWAGPDEPAQLDPSQFMTQTPDAIAQEQTRALRVELAEARSQREQERDQLTLELRSMREAQAASEKRHADEMAQRDKESFQREMEMMREQIRSPNAPPATPPSTNFAELMAAVAPVMTAFVQSGTDRTAAANQLQQASMESNSKALTTFMTAKKGDGEMVKLFEVLATAVLPMVVTMMESKSPSKMAEVISTMGENNMTQLSLLSQFMQQMMGGEADNPWMTVVQQGIKSITDVAEQMAEVGRESAGTGRVGFPVPTTGAAQQPQPQQTPGQQQAVPADMSPQDIANAIQQTAGIPKELTTKPWFDVFVALHGRDEPAAVAKQIATLIETCHEGRTMPPMFVGFFESDNDPSTYLLPFLQQIPIGADQVYCNAVLKAFDEAFTEEESHKAEVVQPGSNGVADAQPAQPATASPGWNAPKQPEFVRS